MDEGVAVCPLLAALRKAAQQLGLEEQAAEGAWDVLRSNRIKAVWDHAGQA